MCSELSRKEVGGACGQVTACRLRVTGKNFVEIQEDGC